MLTRKVTLLAKKETTYATDATPVAADAVLVKSGVDVKVVGEELTRDFYRSSLSPLAHVIGERYAEVKFATELKGQGAAGTATEVSPLFQACGFAETVTGGTSVVYAPSSAAFSSVTLYIYRDGIIYKVLGCRGSFDVDMTVGKYGVINWTFQGLYQVPVDGALVAGASYDATLPPICFGATFSIGGYSAVATKLALNMANSLAMRKDLNNTTGIREVLITGWDDRGGSFDPEAIVEATHPFYGNWIGGVQSALTITIGSAAGNRCVITAPKVQYKAITPGDRDGIYVYDVPLRLAQNTGDDEVIFSFT